MATCVPISDLKDSAAFAEKVARAGEPVIVTLSSTQTYSESIAARRRRST